ncbi:MAG: hypothetical protein WA958_08815 [Tunicatimonas sp.]
MNRSVERLVVNRRLPDSFFTLPPRVYQALPFGLREDSDAVHRLVSEAQDLHDTVLYTDHRTVRLLGIFPRTNDTACFAYWEATDPVASQAAFERFEEEADERGIRYVRGPLTFNTFHRYRLRLHTPSWMMFDREPVNPPAYVGWLQHQNYTPSLRFESRMMRSAHMPQLYQSKEEYLATLTDLPFRFLALTPEVWEARARELFTLVDAIFSRNPGYQPVTYAQFSQLYGLDFARQLCPYSSVLLEDRASAQLVGMSFCLPNYQPLRRSATPVFARDYPQLTHKTLLIKSVGVHPQYRRRGLMTYLGAYCMQTFTRHYEDAIFCLMRADNPSLRFTDDLPFEQAAYALFEKSLGSGSSTGR